MESNSNRKKLGIALVGLGTYSSEQLAPALQETNKCYLAGIVTGSKKKAMSWSEKYNIPEKNIYSYDNFDDIAQNPDIDIVYVVLPNSMHAEYTIRAAKAGKHVICEKPMALNVEDCQKMIDACEKARKLLSIGYRLHFEPHNLEMMRLGKNEVYGPIQKMSGSHGIDVGDPSQWRLKKDLAGGGPLMDVGIYTVQGLIYTLGKEPIAITMAREEKTDFEKFKDVEETLYWSMEFPDGVIATCKTSYNASYDILRAEAKNGWFEISPAHSYSGIKGRTHEGPMDLKQVNQQALQMDAFAEDVLANRQSKVNGAMGLRDVKILNAIYKALETGERVDL